MSTLSVQRVGHLNHVARGYDDLLGGYRRVLGGTPFREWEIPALGTRNALVTVSDTCVELFSPDLGDGPMGAWLRSNPPGWHSLEWTVASLEESVDVCRERGIRITDHAPGQYLFTHPRDCRGICLELTEHHFADDPRDDPSIAPQPSWWRDKHPLGILGLVGLRVSASDASAAANWLVELTGAEPLGRRRRSGLGAEAVLVQLPGQVVEFVEPVGEGSLAAFVADRGERLHSVVLAVADIDRAREHLREIGVPHGPGASDDALTIDPLATAGARYELVAAGSR